jgi:hypothetical protein
VKAEAPDGPVPDLSGFQSIDVSRGPDEVVERTASVLGAHLHEHIAVQNGYLIKGKLRMLRGDGRELDAEAIEDSEAIESFSPARSEYVPD